MVLLHLQNGHTHLTHGHLLRDDAAAVCNHCDIPLLFFTLSSHAYFNTKNSIFHLFCMMRNILGGDPDNILDIMAFLCVIGIDSFI
jgi:hypothetical protein